MNDPASPVKAVPSQSFVRAPTWVVFGVPFLALTLLVGVELGGFNTSLFYALNTLSNHTGPAFWANVTILGDGLVCAVLFLPWIRKHPARIWGGILGALFMFVVLRVFKGLLLHYMAPMTG